MANKILQWIGDVLKGLIEVATKKIKINMLNRINNIHFQVDTMIIVPDKEMAAFLAETIKDRLVESHMPEQETTDESKETEAKL